MENLETEFEKLSFEDKKNLLDLINSIKTRAEFLEKIYICEDLKFLIKKIEWNKSSDIDFIKIINELNRITLSRNIDEIVRNECKNFLNEPINQIYPYTFQHLNLDKFTLEDLKKFFLEPCFEENRKKIIINMNKNSFLFINYLMFSDLDDFEILKVKNITTNTTNDLDDFEIPKVKNITTITTNDLDDFEILKVKNIATNTTNDLDDFKILSKLFISFVKKKLVNL